MKCLHTRLKTKAPFDRSSFHRHGRAKTSWTVSGLKFFARWYLLFLNECKGKWSKPQVSVVFPNLWLWIVICLRQVLVEYTLGILCCRVWERNHLVLLMATVRRARCGENWEKFLKGELKGERDIYIWKIGLHHLSHPY